MTPTFVENALLPRNGNAFNRNAAPMKLAQKIEVKKPVTSLRLTLDSFDEIGAQSFGAALIIHEGEGESHGSDLRP